jgi:putative PIN family toxin of toxin-antitoxin system
VCDTKVIRAVIDTTVLIAALRSSSGASHQILLAADRGDFEVALSVPLLAEYDDVASRPASGISISATAVDSIIGRIAMLAHKQPIYYLWRPLLPDPKDDMVLEVAIASGASHIVTFNQKDLRPATGFGIAVVKPSEFIKLLP